MLQYSETPAPLAYCVISELLFLEKAQFLENFVPEALRERSTDRQVTWW